MNQEAQDPQVEGDVTEQDDGADFCIETVDQFGQLVVGWHKQAMATLLHLAKVPEGTEVKIGDEPTFKMEGDIHKGFVLGLQLAMNYIGKLPFEAHIEEDNEANAPIPD